MTERKLSQKMYNEINWNGIDLQQPPPEEEPARQHYFIKLLKGWMDGIVKEKGRKLLCCVNTFGCQMNARDSEKILGILKCIGYEETASENADLVVFNTCTVRENANLKVYGRIGQLKKYKSKNPDMVIMLCGCMMQEREAVAKIKRSYRNVDVVFGTHNIYKFAELLAMKVLDSEGSSKMVVDVWEDAEIIVENLPAERKYPFKSGVNIMYGCNNFCSYCIVPYVRGRERSREPKDIIREIEKLVSEGVVEVMLLGQNVNSYGKTLEESMSFAQLLQEVEKIDGLERIRFMTSHPKDLSDELIQVMKNSRKICRHLHLPLQSGSTRILEAMNRRYTKEQYLELVYKIRREIPDLSITTDIIVGFPGETAADVDETIDVVRKAQYDNAYTFIYSRRTGTPAATMPSPASEEEIKENFDRLLKVVQETARSRVGRLTGEVHSALVEEVNEHDSSLVSGRLSNNTIVHFPGDASLIGKIVDVKLLEAHGFYYMGE